MPRDRLDEADDRELVAAIGEGDEAAMAEVMRRHRSAVVAFARRLVGDHARADEIARTCSSASGSGGTASIPSGAP